jgi:hypothetical protein
VREAHNSGREEVLERLREHLREIRSRRVDVPECK